MAQRHAHVGAQHPNVLSRSRTERLFGRRSDGSLPKPARQAEVDGTHAQPKLIQRVQILVSTSCWCDFANSRGGTGTQGTLSLQRHCFSAFLFWV